MHYPFQAGRDGGSVPALSVPGGERWSGAAADRAHVLLRDLPIKLDDEPGDLDRAWGLSRRYDNHPIYDLLYVALAERHKAQLITADSALRERLVGLDWIIAPEALLG